MDVLRVDPYLFVLSNEFDEDIDLESVGLEVDEDYIVKSDDIEEGNVTLNNGGIISRGRTLGDAVDNYEVVWSEVENEYPNVESDHELVNTVFAAYISIDEDESVEDIQDYLAELEDVDHRRLKTSEAETSFKFVDVGLSPIGFETVDVPDDTTHRIVIIGFNEDVDGSYADYIENYLEQF